MYIYIHTHTHTHTEHAEHEREGGEGSGQGRGGGGQGSRSHCGALGSGTSQIKRSAGECVDGSRQEKKTPREGRAELDRAVEVEVGASVTDRYRPLQPHVRGWHARTHRHTHAHARTHERIRYRPLQTVTGRWAQRSYIHTHASTLCTPCDQIWYRPRNGL